MRISALELIAYGPFRGLTLDLSAPGVHLVFGRNEAGKSTTLRAIRGLLYGIDVRTGDAHVHKMGDLRIGGTLVGGDGASVRVVRRKGARSTLLDENEKAIDDAVVQRLLRGVSEETFVHAFGLDHETLQAGAQALLDGRGDVGGSLFDASVGGGADARKLLAALEEEADRLYKPRASAPLLNDALKAFSEAQKLVKERQSLPEAYVAQQRALEEAKAERAEQAARRSELTSKKALLERARKRIPLQRRRALVEQSLATLGELGKNAARVSSLHSRLAAYERALEARRVDLAELDRLRDRSEQAARRAGLAADATTATRSVGADRAAARIQKLVLDRTKLGQRMDAARAEIVRGERELVRLREIAGAGASGTTETHALARAVEHARALGDAEKRNAAERGRAGRRRAEVESRAAALGSFEGTIDELVALRLPPTPTIERLSARAQDLDRVVQQKNERASSLETEVLSVERQIAEHAGDFAPPEASDLRAARAARDEAWAELAVADAEARSQRALAFERAMRSADVVADRMIQDAERVTTLARLRASLETLARQRAQADDDAAAAKAERAALDEEHARLWTPLGVAPLGFAEMRGWIDRHAQVVEAFARVREAELDVEEGASAIASAREGLIAALVAAGSDGGDRRLDELLDLAGAKLDQLEAARRAAADAKGTIAKVEGELDDRRDALVRDEASLGEVRASLASLVEPLGVGPDAADEEIAAALAALGELFSLEDKRADVASRASAAEREVLSFEEDAARAAADLASDLVGQPARDVIVALADRARKAHAAEQDLASIDAQLAELGDDAIDEETAALAAEPDVASRAIDDVSAAIEDVEREVSRLDKSLGGIETGLQKMQLDSGAAEASARAQEALARVRTNAERYARAKVAAIILAREIERYREENQGPMLTLASQLFSRLTLGSFSGVRAGFDDADKPALRCVRGGGAADVDIAGLSEGTRDQLYLSLRLASVLRYAEIAEPMPFVLDDVFIQFDDERSRAALTVIAEIAKRMQVVFFTHHARLVELARAALAPGELTVHELATAPAILAADGATA
ncbi:MAG: AAA family ATPase [Labilithrix sp.]|nr:AAA family ATPase [Labilithrix sp.]